MGMYDYVTVARMIPLPEFPDAFRDGEYFQTKAFENLMDYYRITCNGELLKEESFYEEVPEEKRPFFNDPDFKESPLKQFCGCMTRVVTGEIDTKFHGILRFYTLIDTDTIIDKDWYEYEAKFTDGKLVEIKRVPN